MATKAELDQRIREALQMPEILSAASAATSYNVPREIARDNFCESRRITVAEFFRLSRDERAAVEPTVDMRPLSENLRTLALKGNAEALAILSEMGPTDFAKWSKSKNWYFVAKVLDARRADRAAQRRAREDLELAARLFPVDTTDVESPEFF